MICALALVAWSSLARAHPVSDWELLHLPRLPREIAGALAERGLPDSAGLVGANRDGWDHVAHQRHALLALRLAAARGDEVLAERAWPAIDAAFARQTREGGFATRSGVSRAENLGATSLWLGELAQTLLVLESGPLRGWFRTRTQALRPRVLLLRRWLMSGARELERVNRRTASGALRDALAFTLAGELDHDARVLEEGRRFLRRALTLARKDGRLLEPAPALEAHGASLLRLQVLDIYYPSFANGVAIGRGAQWLITALARRPVVAPPSATDSLGARAGVSELILALLYRAELAEDPKAAAAARQAFERWRADERPLSGRGRP
ncbi:MAG TPA: hypothetical protein VEY91_11290 [Candidatus Limnocylindria bacterium]|nr:hypothetical protein [Candidatus Limnocylindria bacterium]